MIKNEDFRRLEAMLTAAALPADIVCSLIGLAGEASEFDPDPTEDREPGPVLVRLGALAESLGLDRRAAAVRLRQANGSMIEWVGFSVGAIVGADGGETEEADGCDVSAAMVELSTVLAAIVRGTIVTRVSTSNDASLCPDAAASAEIELLHSAVGGGSAMLYRTPETAGERIGELTRATAMIAVGGKGISQIVLHDPPNWAPTPAPAAIFTAVLHGADILMLTTDILDQKSSSNDDEEEIAGGEGSTSKTRRDWRVFSAEGEQVAALLPLVPLTILVPVPRDARLAPRDAARFAGAIGPFRPDRGAVRSALDMMSGGRLASAAADRLAGLWNGRPERAGPMLAAAARIAAADATSEDLRRDGNVVGFSAAATVLTTGLAPHVWSPADLRPKTTFAPFYPELFHSDPDPTLLFNKALRNEPGIRILMVGPPGCGKTAAAAHIARESLGMPAIGLEATDVFHHRLGHMERAISRAFQQAREERAALIVDEADSIVANRAAAAPNASHVVVAATNQILVEMDRHTLPVLVMCNEGDRLDPAFRRRLDIHVEVKPIPEELEGRAMKLILGFTFPEGSLRLDGTSVVADYAGAKRMLRIQGGGPDEALAAVKRARDNRLGRDGRVRKIGF